METPEESRQILIDELAEKTKEHILSNCSEMESVLGYLDDSDLANILVINWKQSDEVLGATLRQLFEGMVDWEANQQAREEVYK